MGKHVTIHLKKLRIASLSVNLSRPMHTALTVATQKVNGALYPRHHFVCT